MATADWTRPELILAVALREETGWAGSPSVHDPRLFELSEFLRAANPALAFDPKFRSPGSVRRKLEDLRTLLPGYAGKRTKGGRATEDVMDSFAESPSRLMQLATFIRSNPGLLKVTEDPDDRSVDDFIDLDEIAEEGPTAAIEGAVARRWAIVRERNPRLRRAKIAQSRRDRGVISCETCGFDFEETFGELGAGYIHVHHRVPLHITNEVENDLSALILLCANCHAMVHRSRPWLRPDELQAIIGGSRGGE
ncbi:HNH endonuclease [Gordonia sp. FQ]|uniref:HNH endonuclease n=1 Tax=Gordonia sp. FQ TaxID=3446634 RepID=UPI003F825071